MNYLIEIERLKTQWRKDLDRIMRRDGRSYLTITEESSVLSRVNSLESQLVNTDAHTTPSNDEPQEDLPTQEDYYSFRVPAKSCNVSEL